MATVRKTITLTDQQDDWIKAQVEGGHYTNDSEYIRDLIRREQERGAEWGVDQAERYTDLLTAAFQVLAESPQPATYS
jgi:putative addiction module CopG family antidote